MDKEDKKSFHLVRYTKVWHDDLAGPEQLIYVVVLIFMYILSIL